MASTAHKTDDEIREIRDAPDVLDKKIDQLVALILASKHMVSWTGAGVSTSCGIPDFRGPNGKWTLAAQHKERDPSIKVVNSLCAAPSPTHLAIVSLLKAGLLKELISTNTDGLHRRSGVHADQISELHGNGNKAICNKCGKFAFVDHRVRVATSAKQHGTGQPCPYAPCKGEMCDTIINFGEYLLTEVYDKANAAGRRADLLLGLGSSFRVITCNALEDIQRGRGKLVIVNLQKTPYDDACALRIFATTDEVMTAVMAKLRIPVEPWKLERWVSIRPSTADSQQAPKAKSKVPTVSSVASDTTLAFQGLSDDDRVPYSWIKKVTLGTMGPDSAFIPSTTSSATLDTKRAFHPIQISTDSKSKERFTHAKLTTFGHRGEPDAIVQLPTAGAQVEYYLVLDTATGAWTAKVTAAPS
jgi:NAD-dependent SIR2 family protein deacetylase